MKAMMNPALRGRTQAWMLLLVSGILSGCGTTRYGIKELGVDVDGVRPVFRWERFESPRSAGDASEFTAVAYEVKVLRIPDGATVYSRRGLSGTEHRLEEPLNPGTKYVWSVRPWFTFRGNRRIGPWSRRVPHGVDPRSPVLPVPPDQFSSFKTPPVAAAPQKDAGAR